ncbi:MAG: histidine kinase N-terminal 7TM domain-containing protein [Anaerolineales bacterium]
MTAGIAITAFSLLLYALTFNLRDRVARTFALILICVVIAFTGEALGSTATVFKQINFWLKVQWVGIVLLPSTYLHFSDALLATTGKPSRWRRIWAVRVSYLLSLAFLVSLALDELVGPLIVDQPPAPHFQPTLITDIFTFYYLLSMFLSWYNFVRAYRRTITPTSRRRMFYLLVGSLAPSLGSFPFLLFSSNFAARSPLLFWVIAVFSNLLVGGLVIVMSYAVAFFGVSWPDRVVKSRLFEWIMRGPVTAIFTLGITTIVRRIGVAFEVDYSALVPIVMVVTILLSEYSITLFHTTWERWLFFGNDRSDVDSLRQFGNRLLTRNDLKQYLELLLAAICDRLRAPGAYIAALNGEGMELIVKIGDSNFDEKKASERVEQMILGKEQETELFQWGNDYIVPLFEEDEQDCHMIGLLGASGIAGNPLDVEQLDALRTLSRRAARALHDRHAQQVALQSLQMLSPEMDYIQSARASGRYTSDPLLLNETSEFESDWAQWVKDALVHYWGGPKFTDNPLMKLQIVRDSLDEHEGNYTNALRAILRRAVNQVRPEGERRFTADWILYNILEMKFLEGKKVREVAMRLAMSEADLYRKQRLAIEAVAKAIYDMEMQARSASKSLEVSE